MKARLLVEAIIEIEGKATDEQIHKALDKIFKPTLTGVLSEEVDGTKNFAVILKEYQTQLVTLTDK